MTTAKPWGSAANAFLKGSATSWLTTALLGQWAFLYYIVVFYSTSTLLGNFHDWSKNTFLVKGYVAVDKVGNLFFVAHVLLAAVVTLGGAIQFIPQIRARAIALHRWHGRLFKARPRERFATAFGLLVLTALMGIGIFGTYMFMWRPLLLRS